MTADRSAPLRGTGLGTGAVRARALSIALRSGLRSAALGTGGVAALVGVWWLISLKMDPVRLPGPDAVARSLVDGFTSLPAMQYASFQSGGIWDGVRYTMVSVLIAVAIGTVVGTVVGVVIGRSRVVREAVQLPLLVIGTVPVLVVLPFLLQWFGTARMAQAGVVMFSTFITVSTIVQQATLNVGERYHHYAQCLGASRGVELRRVVLPAIGPDVVGAVRVALAAGWGFEAIAELLGAQSGAGRIISVMANLSDTAAVVAVIVCLGIVAVAADALVAGIGKWVTRWQS